MFAFITAWNDFLFAYVIMKDQSGYTLPVWLVSFSTSTGTDYGGLIAASTLFALPVVVFFALVQRRAGRGHDRGRGEGLMIIPTPPRLTRRAGSFAPAGGLRVLAAPPAPNARRACSPATSPRRHDPQWTGDPPRPRRARETTVWRATSWTSRRRVRC